MTESDKQLEKLDKIIDQNEQIINLFTMIYFMLKNEIEAVESWGGTGGNQNGFLQ